MNPTHSASQSPSEPGLYVARSPRAVLARVVGLGNAHLATVLQGFLQTQLDAGRRLMAVDFSLCTGLDSTFMGTLAELARHAPERGARLLLVNLSDELQRLLKMLGVLRLLNVRNNIPIEPVDMIRLGPVVDAATRIRRIYDAHVQLSRLDAQNRERFGRFLDAIEREMADEPPLDLGPSFRFDGVIPEFDAADNGLDLDDFVFPGDEDNPTPPPGAPKP